ncbi:MAG TPA: DinB family protein [Granulicella sp.]
MNTIGRPAEDEASSYFFRYIDLIEGSDILTLLSTQLDEALALFATVSEERSLYRYAPDKWSIRQVVGHISDTERIFTFRALWFARNLSGKLLSFDQDVAVAHAHAEDIPYYELLTEMRRVREATLSLFQHLPADAWTRSGISNDHPLTPRAIAYMCAGHMEHHMRLHRALYSS